MNHDAGYPSVEEIRQEIRRVQRKKERNIWRNALLVMILLALAVSGVAYAKHIAVIRVSGNSMEPALRSGDILMYQRSADVEYGSIVVIERDDVLMIKRVIGMPGDQIALTEEGQVIRNGSVLDEPYITHFSLGNSDADYPVTVAEGSYFVMGDNRRVSLDSRNSTVGLIAEEEICGEARLVLWPAYRIGMVAATEDSRKAE